MSWKRCPIQPGRDITPKERDSKIWLLKANPSQCQRPKALMIRVKKVWENLQKKKKKGISSPIPFLLSPESKHKFLLAVCTKQLIISNLAIS